MRAPDATEKTNEHDRTAHEKTKFDETARDKIARDGSVQSRRTEATK